MNCGTDIALGLDWMKTAARSVAAHRGWTGAAGVRAEARM
jgi:hypothetical protein